MKLALIGNMNNNFFALCRYLRDEGIDARLYYFENEQRYFNMSDDTYYNDHNIWCKSLDWNEINFLTKSVAAIRRDLEDRDVFIACGPSMAFLRKAGLIKSTIFSSYGSDIYQLPFHQYSAIKSLSSLVYFIRRFPFVSQMNKAIADCCFVRTDYSNPVNASALERIGVNKKKWVNIVIPMVYTPIYHPNEITKYYHTSEHYPIFKKIRDEADLVIFHHSRHVWSEIVDKGSVKDNNVLFEGFAIFKKSNPGYNAKLVTFEFGPHVEDSKRLISDLGISEDVIWMSKMPRREIMIGLSLCDIGTGQFHYGIVGGGTTWEVLSSGKPILTYRNDQMIKDNRFHYPLINSRSPKEISNHFQRFMTDKEYFEKLGWEGLDWYSNLVGKSVSEFLTLLHRV